MFQFFQNKNSESVNVNDLNQLIGKINLIDVREPGEYRSGHLPTAKNIPMARILSDAESYLVKSEEYHIICQSGARSSRACSVLKEQGFKVINVAGGTGGYRGKLEL